MEESGKSICNICSLKDCLQFDDFDIHKNTETHRLNFLLWAWGKYRKALVKNRHGIEIKSLIRNNDNICDADFKETIDPRKGKHEIRFNHDVFITKANGVKYKFKVKNQRQMEKIYLTSVNLLHPCELFRLCDPLGELNNNHGALIESGQSYRVEVDFSNKHEFISSIKMAISFTFQTIKNETFTIIREMIVAVLDDLNQDVAINQKSPYTNLKWEGVLFTLPCTKGRPHYRYPIPPMYENVFKAGIHSFQGISHIDRNHLNNIVDRLRPGTCTPSNYGFFFHVLLWLEETAQIMMLQKFNMEEVSISLRNDNTLELEVPGLAEKRPSLIVGDYIQLRIHDDHTSYMGIITSVNDQTIWIKYVQQQFISMVRMDETCKIDVKFELGRLPLERMHHGVELCSRNNITSMLFPNVNLSRTPRNMHLDVTNDDFYDKNIPRNQEQKTAVINILNGTSGNAPYIVFGPPGTGKTVTIVEAILQIKKRMKNVKILLCAPANAACDMLTSKLIPFCNKKELIRVHTNTRDWSTVPDEIKPYSNHVDKNYIEVTREMLKNFKIVVSTLIFSGKFVDMSYTPDYVFIDEAAQASEPETAVPISLMNLGKKLILAGDPKQLGPICHSKVAIKYKLGVSLLERLMETNGMYSDHNPRCMTMLKLNFRSHPKVLKVPNDLFYDGRLVAVSQEALNDQIATVSVYSHVFKQKKKKAGQPVEFISVVSKEQREGLSPSFFNIQEMRIVIRCVESILSIPIIKAQQKDIGIVTPYARQVYKIKDALRAKSLSEVEVGTTEIFQGREKRVIIISTVRAQDNLLLHDRKYNLGFVAFNKRFNVALTRAQSKLIIVGCPTVLETSINCLRYMDYCDHLGSYYGTKCVRRTDARKEILQRMKRVNMQDSQYRH